MESPAIARYIPRKSKKRVFPGSSPASMEPEVIEISPPTDNRTSKLKAKAIEHKEPVFHEIIDVDMDEDRNDVVFLEGKVESSQKRKDAMAISLGSSVVQLDLMDRVHSTKKGKAAAIISSALEAQLGLVNNNCSLKSSAPGFDNFFDLEGLGSDVYADDYLSLQSHFDNMDLPSGVEAPIPWLPDMVQKKTKASSNQVTSHSRLESSIVNPSWASACHSRIKNSLSVGNGSSSSSTREQIDMRHVPSVGTTHKIHHINMPSGYGHDQLGSMKVPQPSSYFSNTSNTRVGSSTSSSFSQLPKGIAYPLKTNAPISNWHNSNMKNHLELNDGHSSFVSIPEPAFLRSAEDLLVDLYARNRPRSSSLVESSSDTGLDNKDVLKRYESFKKFDTVVDHSDHHYLSQSSAMKQPPKNWAKKIQDEWRILEKDLPDTIFVRVYESRMDLLRAVIIGAEGTPYHDGLFFFDVCFPTGYPNVPPLVHYHSGGLRINPNLYESGKVCLSLLNTWTGGQKERWVPGVSTMLQVLVSIQGLILNTKPYFNEPGFANSSGSVLGEQCSLDYNERTLILSLKTMVYSMKKPPKNFEDLVIGHFRNRVRDILMACKAYTEGVQVGCLVRGGVQDVDEGNKSCSTKFRNDVASYIKTLVGSFEKIGAKEAQEFLPLSEKISTLPAPAPTHLAHPHAYSPFPFPSIASYNHY